VMDAAAVVDPEMAAVERRRIVERDDGNSRAAAVGDGETQMDIDALRRRLIEGQAVPIAAWGVRWAVAR